MLTSASEIILKYKQEEKKCIGNWSHELEAVELKLLIAA